MVQHFGRFINNIGLCKYHQPDQQTGEEILADIECYENSQTDIFCKKKIINWFDVKMILIGSTIMLFSNGTGNYKAFVYYISICS